MDYMDGVDTGEDVVDFKEGQLGKHLAQATPLLHIEVHNFLADRKEQQKKWCLELQQWGVHKGQAESYTNWEQYQAPGLVKCWEYTGAGERGVGQGPKDEALSRSVWNNWKYLILDLKGSVLALREAWRRDENRDDANAPLANDDAFLTPVEIVQMCNLLPGDAEEAKTIIPSLNRFEDKDLNIVVTKINDVNDKPM